MNGSSSADRIGAAVFGESEGRSLREALEQQYDRILHEHGAALRRVAASYEADPSRREDLFQEVCLALWQALPRFRGECSERTFAFRIAHNRGLSHGWRSRTHAAELEEAEAVADPRQSPEAEVQEGERRSRLRAAVRSLPPMARQVVVLSLEGLGHREIGEVLGLSENNVAVRLSRARKLLRQALDAAGGRR